MGVPKLWSSLKPYWKPTKFLAFSPSQARFTFSWFYYVYSYSLIVCLVHILVFVSGLLCFHLLLMLYSTLLWHFQFNYFEHKISYNAESSEFCWCFQRGDVLRIIRMTADGWWLAQDSKGNRGVVPKSYLKVCNQWNTCNQLSNTFLKQAFSKLQMKRYTI